MRERMKRKEPIGMAQVMQEFVREMKLASGLNTQLVFEAWDKVSGAAGMTASRFFRDGVLYITLNSSVARNRLSFRLDAITKGINDSLLANPLFVRDDPRSRLVSKIVLK